MPISRQRTYVGARRDSSKRSGFAPPRRRPPMKRTSRKGAYRKVNKKAMAIRRAPLVETKRKDDNAVRAANFFAGGGSIANILPDRTEFNIYDTEHTLMDPASYYCWSQGLDQSQHIGQAVNVKYTNMKIQVRFPQPSVSTPAPYVDPQIIPDQPMNYELVWGWVPAPLQLTGSTTPAVNNVTLTQIRNHVNHRITDYFNARKDKLNFIPKKDATIRIIGRKKVRPDLRHTSTVPPLADEDGEMTVGTIPDYYTEISWKHNNRKIWLEQTGNFNGNSDLIAMYPNYTWLPFAVLVNWNWDEINSHTTHGKKLECPSLAWNSITYFSDS